MKVKREPGAFSCSFNPDKKNKMKVKINEAGVELFFGEFFPVWVWLYNGKVSVSLNKLAPYKSKDYYNLLWQTLKEKGK
jgi:hypothetical protein